MEFKNICLECAHYKVCKDKEKFIEKSKSIYYSIEDSDILKISIDCKNFLKSNKRICNVAERAHLEENYPNAIKLPIAKISSGLPLKGEDKMVNFESNLMYSKYAFGRLVTNADLDSEEKETEDGRDL